jgi:hypothetical protein
MSLKWSLGRSFSPLYSAWHASNVQSRSICPKYVKNQSTPGVLGLILRVIGYCVMGASTILLMWLERYEITIFSKPQSR